MGDTEMEGISAEKILLPSKVLEESQDNQSFTNKRTDTQKKNSTSFSSYRNYHPKDNQFDYIKNDKKENYLNRPKREYPDLDGLYLLVKQCKKKEGRNLDVFVRNHSRFSLRVSIKDYEEIKKKQNEKVKQLYKSCRDYFPKIKTRKTEFFEKIASDTSNDYDLQPKANSPETVYIQSIMLDDSNDVDMTSTDAGENSTTEISKDASISQNIGSPIHKTEIVNDEEVEIEKNRCFKPNETSTDAAENSTAEISKDASISQNIGSPIHKTKIVIDEEVEIEKNRCFRPNETSTDAAKSKMSNRYDINDYDMNDYGINDYDSENTSDFEWMDDDEIEKDFSRKPSTDAPTSKIPRDCCLYHYVKYIKSLDLESTSSESSIKSDVDENPEEDYLLLSPKKYPAKLPNDESEIMSDDESIEGLGFGREAYIVSKLSLKKSAKWNINQDSGKIEQVADNPPQNEVSQKTFTLAMNRFMSDLKSQKEYIIPDESAVQGTSKQEASEQDTPELGTPEEDAPETRFFAA